MNTRKDETEVHYLVGFGNSLWPVTTSTPAQAIREVKERILRENNRPTLIDRISENNAEILVMNDSRDVFFACETHGDFFEKAPEDVIERMSRLLPPRKYRLRSTKPGN